MQITINFTIIIQIINFLIAYFLLTKYFLKPAVDVLDAKINNRDLLKSKVSDLSFSVDNQLNKINLLWKSSKAKFSSYLKDCSIDKDYKKLNIKPIKEVNLNLDKNQIVDEVSNNLINELENVS